MRLIDADSSELFDKCYCPQDWSGNESYPLMIEWNDIENAPTIDAEPVRHGRWKEVSGGRIICNNCGHYPLYDYFGRQRLSFYCWHCGVKMYGGCEDERND